MQIIAGILREDLLYTYCKVLPKSLQKILLRNNTLYY